jgi:hypothetical protein
VLVAGLLALTPFVAERATNPQTNVPVDQPFPPEVVTRELRFALPVAFVSWAGLSLFLSLVPSYLAATLHALNPAVGAGAVVVMQFASLIVTMSFRNIGAQRGGIVGSIVSVSGVATLIVGTSANIWPLVVLATLMVGGGGGLASAASFGIAGRIGRGHRARVFARWYVAAYAGYSLPVLGIGLIAVYTSFTTAFISVAALLAIVTAVLPRLQPDRQREVPVEMELAPRAA